MKNEVFGTAKEEVKAVAKKADTTKTTTEAAEKKASKKPAAKKETEAKAEKKPAAKKATTAKKTTTKKAAAKVEMFVQFNGNQVDEVTLVDRVKADCKKQKVTVEDLKMYVKPEENACYYVANGNIAGKVTLF